MPFNSIANPFVALVETKPDLILRGSRSVGLSTKGQARLDAALANFTEIYVEAGSGSGGHLIECAARTPHALFIGLELRFKRVYRTAEKAEERGLKNILVIQHDASQLCSLFKPGSLSGIFVLFPDPWEKRRWRKHRILNDLFLDNAAELLKTGGMFHYKTDHPQYFEETVKKFDRRKDFAVLRLSRNLHQEEQNPGNIESEFEKLFKSKQLPIHLLELRRL